MRQRIYDSTFFSFTSFFITKNCVSKRKTNIALSRLGLILTRNFKISKFHNVTKTIDCIYSLPLPILMKIEIPTVGRLVRDEKAIQFHIIICRLFDAYELDTNLHQFGCVLVSVPLFIALFSISNNRYKHTKRIIKTT